jgi:hypothetical protein
MHRFQINLINKLFLHGESVNAPFIYGARQHYKVQNCKPAKSTGSTQVQIQKVFLVSEQTASANWILHGQSAKTNVRIMAITNLLLCVHFRKKNSKIALMPIFQK